MNINDSFPSNYLKASDLLGRRIEVIMSDVKTEKLGDDFRPVLYFKGKDKGLVLNKTNANTIVSAYGQETDGWFGKPIILYEAQVEFKGRMTPGLRVDVPRGQRLAQVPIDQDRPPPTTYDVGDDEVPF